MTSWLPTHLREFTWLTNQKSYLKPSGSLSRGKSMKKDPVRFPWKLLGQLCHRNELFNIVIHKNQSFSTLSGKIFVEKLLLSRKIDAEARTYGKMQKNIKVDRVPRQILPNGGEFSFFVLTLHMHKISSSYGFTNGNGAPIFRELSDPDNFVKFHCTWHISLLLLSGIQYQISTFWQIL